MLNNIWTKRKKKCEKKQLRNKYVSKRKWIRLKNYSILQNIKIIIQKNKK